MDAAHFVRVLKSDVHFAGIPVLVVNGTLAITQDRKEVLTSAPHDFLQRFESGIAW